MSTACTDAVFFDLDDLSEGFLAFGVFASFLGREGPACAMSLR